MKDLFTAAQAVIAGIALTAFIYWFLNFLVHRLPERIKKVIEPYVFIGPVLLLIGLFIVWPTLQSIRLSFMEEAIDGSTTWIGFQNLSYLAYQDLTTCKFPLGLSITSSKAIVLSLPN